MKVTAMFLAATLSLVAADPQPPIPGRPLPINAPGALTLSLSTTETAFKLDSPILVTITLANTGSTTAYLESAQPMPEYWDFDFSLTLNGSAVPKTAFHRAIRRERLPGDPPGPGIMSANPAVLVPGKIAFAAVDLKKLYDISQPGSYVFSVERPPDEFTKEPFYSPPITINITR